MERENTRGKKRKGKKQENRREENIGRKEEREGKKTSMVPHQHGKKVTE